MEAVAAIPEVPTDLLVEKKAEPKQDIWKPAPIKQAINRILIGEVVNQPYSVVQMYLLLV